MTTPIRFTDLSTADSSASVAARKGVCTRFFAANPQSEASKSYNATDYRAFYLNSRSSAEEGDENCHISLLTGFRVAIDDRGGIQHLPYVMMTFEGPVTLETVACFGDSLEMDSERYESILADFGGADIRKRLAAVHAWGEHVATAASKLKTHLAESNPGAEVSILDTARDEEWMDRPATFARRARATIFGPDTKTACAYSKSVSSFHLEYTDGARARVSKKVDVLSNIVLQHGGSDDSFFYTPVHECDIFPGGTNPGILADLSQKLKVRGLFHATPDGWSRNDPLVIEEDLQKPVNVSDKLVRAFCEATKAASVVSETLHSLAMLCHFDPHSQINPIFRGT